MRVTVSSKGQMTLPAEARKKLGIRAGTLLDVIVVGDDRLQIVKVGGSIRDLFGCLPKPRRALSVEEMNDAIARGAAGLP